jgi:hypothetical protein
MPKKPEDIIKSIIAEFSKAKMDLVSEKATQGVADFAASMVKKRTRLGYGVNVGEKQKLDALSPSYKLYRQGKIAFFSKGTGSSRLRIPYKPKNKPALYEETTPTKSNLTFTGQMLNSLYGKAIGAGRFLISLSGDRNKTVAGYAVDLGRPFLAFSRAEVQQVIGQYRKLIISFFRKGKK